MARIIHVSNFNLLRLKRCYLNSASFKISNGLIRNGHHVINFPDRDLCRMFGFGHMNWLGRKRVNKHLITFCKSIKPDAILLGHADTITTETLKEIKKLLPNVKILQWNVDWIVPGLDDENIDVIKSKLNVVDATLVTTAESKLLKQFEKEDKFVGFLPNITDNSIETFDMFEKESSEYDMMFCASRNGIRQFCSKNVRVSDIVNDIKEKLPNLKMLLAGFSREQSLDGIDYQNAHGKCVIGFNLSRVNDVYLYTSDRLAHVVGNGQMAIIDRRTGYGDIFNDDEMVFYETREEFFEKLKYYSSNPKERMRVAKKGCEKYRKLFNEKVVAKYIMDILFDKLDKSEYCWLNK